MSRKELEKRVEVLRKGLPSLTEAQVRWAKSCFKKTALNCRDEVWCNCCGQSWKGMLKKGTEAVCPHCGETLTAAKSVRTYDNRSKFVSFVTRKAEWQVIRHFEVTRICRKGNREAFTICEAVQDWINADGYEIYVARPVIVYGWVYKFRYGAPMKIRHAPSPYSCNADRYHIHAYHIYPRWSLLPEARLRGVKLYHDDMAPDRWVSLLLRNDEAERYAKMGQWAVVQEIDCCGRVYHERSVKIANRHHYVISDKTLWNDCISAMAYLGIDIYKPENICITDIRETHDRLQEEKRRKMKEDRDRKNARDLAYWTAEYPKRHRRFLGIRFDNGRFFASVLQSVDEFREEGEAMNHCVFNMGYYKNDESLIFSIRDRDGNRVETAEVIVPTLRIAQCQGNHNTDTPYHNEIVSFLQNNLWRVKNAAS